MVKWPRGQEIQLERERELEPSSVASQRLSFCGRVEKHVATGAAGSEERNSATARQSYFFSTPTQLTAIVATKQSHYYSLG